VYNYYQATFQELRCNLEKIEIHDHTTTTNSISTQQQHQAAPTTSAVYLSFLLPALQYMQTSILGSSGEECTMLKSAAD
jgi:hypothetical protein